MLKIDLMNEFTMNQRGCAYKPMRGFRAIAMALLVAIMFVLGGCSKSDSSHSTNSGDPNDFQEDYKAQIAAFGFFTSETRAELQGLFSKYNKLIPGESLILDDYLYPSEKEDLENSLDNDGKVNLKFARKGCEVSKTSTSGEKPPSLNSPFISTTKFLLSGTSCPFDYKGHRSIKVTFQTPKSSVMETVSDSSSKILHPEWVSEVRFSEWSLKYEINQKNLEVTRNETTGDVISGSSYTQIQSDSKFILSDGANIDVISKAESIKVPGSKKMRVMRLFKTKSGNLSILITRINDKFEYEINGKAASEAEIMEFASIALLKI